MVKNIVIIALVVILGFVAWRLAGQNTDADGVAGDGNTSPDTVKYNPLLPDTGAIEKAQEVVEKSVEKVDGTTVDLSGRRLTKVSQDVFTLTDTTTLDLSDNALSGALPAEVRLLSKLRVLDLSNNNFTGVPAEVGQLSELRVLNLSNNPITGLPYEIGNLGKLERLDLSGTSYSRADLKTIREKLPSTVVIVTD